MVSMKATIDIPDDIYRQVKAKSALQGLAVREVAIALFQAWVEQSDVSPTESATNQTGSASTPAPQWFGSLRKYAHNAQGKYDMEAVRKSIAQGRAKTGKSL